MNDGGPAFPRSAGKAEMPNGERMTYGEQDGMSLRDWFAGQALAGLIACPETSDGVDPATFKVVAARNSYGYADAMIAEREKK